MVLSTWGRPESPASRARDAFFVTKMIRSITLGDGALALALGLPERGMPEILGVGRDAVGAAFVAERARRTNGMDRAVPAAVLLPTGGMGFFGWPAIAGHRDGRDFVVEFSGWRVEDAPDGAVLSAEDAVAKLGVEIRLTSRGGALTSAAKIANRGETAFVLDRCMAGSLVFPEGPATLTRFVGMWGCEFHRVDEPLGAGLVLSENRRGRTSHDRSPSLILSSRRQTLAVHLGWSGNHVLSIDTLDDGRRLVHAGELFEPGEMRLEPGRSYESPTVYFADEPATLVERVRGLIPWPGGAMRPRPVTINTWEGNYFNHKLPSLMAQADAAAELGVERFVLDDGWFGRRDAGNASLGDWRVDRRKYPQGLRPLVERVRARGMEFGIWFEPEMVNPESDLYRAHPDWALQIAGRPLLLSRSQLVLDLSRPAVFDYLFGSIDAVLGDISVACIKWDMNRDLTHVAGADGRAATARQTRAVYALIDRVRAAYPDIEIETCSSGGGRADYGVLQRAHRIWTSDCTDALERLEIQRGARMLFPPEIMGAHISASPNHQTHRRLSLSFRALVALAYHLGVEMDPRALSDEDRSELKEWIALHKRLRPLLHKGAAQFALEPYDGRYVWGAADDDTIVAIVAQGPAMPGEQPPPLRLPAARVAKGAWRVALCRPEAPEFAHVSSSQRDLIAGRVDLSRESLTSVGLPLPRLYPESGFLLELKRVAAT